MFEPMVSILVPVYNHEKYIHECLNSFLELKYKNWEVLICDDGSTDSSVDVIKKWREHNRSVQFTLLTQENQGVCRTLNRLIESASGEYIVICASDDLLLPNSLSDRMAIMISMPEVDAVIGDAIVIDEFSHETNHSAMRSLYHANFKALMSNLSRELVLNWSVVGPTFLARRSLYDKVGLYDVNLQVEDRDFYLRCLAMATVRFLPVAVAKYRIHSTNASRKSLSARAKVWHQVALSNVKNEGLYSGLEYWFLASHRFDLTLLSWGGNVFIWFILYAYRLHRRLFFIALYKVASGVLSK